MEKQNEQKNDLRHVNTAVPISSISALPGIQEGIQYLMPETVFRQEKPTDNRPFLCNICGNRFRQQCHLTQHIRIHTNDRPYQCSHCDKAFKQKSQVRKLISLTVEIYTQSFHVIIWLSKISAEFGGFLFLKTVLDDSICTF